MRLPRHEDEPQEERRQHQRHAPPPPPLGLGRPQEGAARHHDGHGEGEGEHQGQGEGEVEVDEEVAEVEEGALDAVEVRAAVPRGEDVVEDEVEDGAGPLAVEHAISGHGCSLGGRGERDKSISETEQCMPALTMQHPQLNPSRHNFTESSQGP